ncbi:MULTISPECIES: Hpt domain-containing protein [unclassified Pseudoalteromonas]|uniref:Hpt domain-containing protein n=1 Tax=unclassified Pseudoalteromonas TaxID=194690 RepID=UPI00040C6703|nr:MULTISPECIES: Hpt domain-containing protein [unclassified Pseudoalteromonas]MDC9496078.1 Hpt domain-containing protein [Pseudoalteromonas sp. Angola-20]MDC9515658.1 Hpt domain-containing protein [Pseudoalteromonas sp. Angola-22]MDC9532141.1 Hpt domain-containing protein [Pseudoalteromonas sp. Angola-9]TMP84781.1 TMAO reductase system sensor histidine kinase/response regulator TorS [Pseudoalteromonas sp. S983]
MPIPEEYIDNTITQAHVLAQLEQDVGSLTLVRLVNLFINELEEMRVRLKNAVDEQDEDNIKDIMHVLKNSAALYGALTLAALASQLHDYPPVTIEENIHAAQIVQHNLEKTHAAYQVIANNIT